MELEERRPTEPIYRLGRRPDAWQPPEWFLAHSDGTFGNRFDDPEGYYRVLYASSQRLACFVETLARFRPLENWAIIEPFPLEHATSKDFSDDDPDLLEALRLHGIRLS